MERNDAAAVSPNRPPRKWNGGARKPVRQASRQSAATELGPLSRPFRFGANSQLFGTRSQDFKANDPLKQAAHEPTRHQRQLLWSHDSIRPVLLAFHRVAAASV